MNSATDVSFRSDGALFAFFESEGSSGLGSNFAWDMRNNSWIDFVLTENCCGRGHAIAFADGDLFYASTGTLKFGNSGSVDQPYIDNFFGALPLEFTEINAMDFDTTNNILYALVRKYDTDSLATINTTTGAVTIKGPIITDSGQSLSDVEGIAWLVQPRDVEIPQIVNNMVKFIPTGFQKTIRFTKVFPASKCGCRDSDDALFYFWARLENTSNNSLTNLTVSVNTLTNNNLLILGTDPRPQIAFIGAETGGVGVLWTLPETTGYYVDGVLAPGEITVPLFGICLDKIKPFDFWVDVLGKVQ